MSIETVAEGLKGVVVGESEICFIDGKDERLIYRGYDIHDLVKHSNYEEVIYLLWYGKLPTKKQFDELYSSLTASRELSKGIIFIMNEIDPKF